MNASINKRWLSDNVARGVGFAVDDGGYNILLATNEADVDDLQ